MKPDYTRAAEKAAEVLIRYGICRTPVAPLPILEQLDNVLVLSFSDVSESTGVSHPELVHNLFGCNRDAITSIHTENGRPTYIVAYNSLLPFSAIQHALAREMGHILMGHQENTPENAAEASAFVQYLLCPRPLIHTIQATGIRITMDLLANLTGAYDHDILTMRRIPKTSIPASLNRFIRNNMMPFVINFFDYYRPVSVHDGSALVDFGTYMDGYEE